MLNCERKRPVTRVKPGVVREVIPIHPVARRSGRLPEGPVAMPRRRRFGLLQAALTISLLAHLVGLGAMWAWPATPPPPDGMLLTTAVQRVHLDPGALQAYRELAVDHPPVAGRPVPPPAPAPPPPPPGIHLMVQAPAPPRPIPRVINRPPLPAAPVPAPVLRPTPSPAPAAVAQAAPPPAPAAPPPAPAPSPEAPLPSPSPAPAEANVVVDPTADFAVVLGYHNDDRIRRDEKGFLVLDVGQISDLPDVKPVLAQVPRGVIRLGEAARYGLKALDRVEGEVSLAVEAPSGLGALVMPTKVTILDLTVQGRAPDVATRDRLLNFVQEQVVSTQWFPASNRGMLLARSEQSFRFQVLQVRDASVAGLPGERR